MGLERDPEFQIPESKHKEAVSDCENGKEREIYPFETPDGNVAFRMTAKQIVEAVKSGQLTVVGE